MADQPLATNHPAAQPSKPLNDRAGRLDAEIRRLKTEFEREQAKVQAPDGTSARKRF